MSIRGGESHSGPSSATQEPLESRRDRGHGGREHDGCGGVGAGPSMVIQESQNVATDEAKKQSPGCFECFRAHTSCPGGTQCRTCVLREVRCTYDPRKIARLGGNSTRSSIVVRDCAGTVGLDTTEAGPYLHFLPNGTSQVQPPAYEAPQAFVDDPENARIKRWLAWNEAHRSRANVRSRTHAANQQLSRNQPNRRRDEHFTGQSSAAGLNQQATEESHLINAREVAQEPPQTTVTATFASNFHKKGKRAESQAQSQLSASGATHPYTTTPIQPTLHTLRKQGKRAPRAQSWTAATDLTPVKNNRRTRSVDVDDGASDCDLAKMDADTFEVDLGDFDRAMEEALTIVTTHARLHTGSNVAQIWKQYAHCGLKQTHEAISILERYLKNNTPTFSLQFLQPLERMNPTGSQAIQTLFDAEVEVVRGLYEDAQTLFWAQAFKDNRWLGWERERERGESWESWGERRKGIKDKQPEWGSELGKEILCG